MYNWGNYTPILTAVKGGIILIVSSHLKFRFVNCLRISRPLKQLSKASVWLLSQEYFFKTFSANISSKHFHHLWQRVFSKIPCFRHFLLNTFRRNPLKSEDCYFRHLTNIQTTKGLFQKTFYGNTLKMEAAFRI